MDNKIIDMYFDESQTGVSAEVHSDDDFSIKVTKYERNEEKSKELHEVIEPVSSTEIFVSKVEIDSIIKALRFIEGEG